MNNINNNNNKKSTINNNNNNINYDRYKKAMIPSTISGGSGGEKQNVVLQPPTPINSNTPSLSSSSSSLSHKYKQNHRYNGSGKKHKKNSSFQQQIDNEMQLAIEISKAEYESTQHQKNTTTPLNTSNNGITNTPLSNSGNSINNKNNNKKKTSIDVTHLINFIGHKEQQYYHNNNNNRRNNNSNNNNHHNNHHNNKFNKEKEQKVKESSFLQAKYSFYINPYGTYTNSLSNPDIIVSWNKIEQAIYLLNQPNGQEYQCPICFDPPLAPKITKCGHIGCYGCLLRNLSHTDKCALCMKPILKEDLKSVKIIPVKKFEENCEIDLELIQYIEGSTVPFLSSSQQLPSDKISFPNVSDKNSVFSRFSVLYDIEEILKKEVEELDTAIVAATSEHEYQTVKYLTFAQRDVELRRNDFKKLVESRKPQENVFEIKSIPKNQNQIQFDSFQYSSNPEIKYALEEFYNSSDSPTSSYSDSDWDNFLENNVEYQKDQEKIKKQQTTVNNSNSTVTVTSTTPTTTTANNNTVNIIQNYSYENQPFDNFYFIYQSNDGQDIYLHPLCMRILSKEFLEKGLPLPNQINRAKILECENLEITKQIRNQYKALSVIPQTTPITFIEIDLSNLVSKSTLDQFSSELSSRHNHRENKRRQEQRKLKSKEKERLIDMKRSVEIREIYEKEKLVKQEQEKQRLEIERLELEEYQKQQLLLKSKLNSNQPPLPPPKFSSVLQAITQHKNIESNIEFPTLNKSNNKI